LTITEITEFSKKKNKISFENGEFLVVYKGMTDTEATELSEETYAALFKEMVRYAKRRAMNLLIKSDRSVAEIRSKLSEDGHNPEIIAEVLKFLDSYGYLDDRRTAVQIVKSLREQKSIREIRSKLKMRGISDEDAEYAVNTEYPQPQASMNDAGSEGDLSEHEISVMVSKLKRSGMTPEMIHALDRKDRDKLAAKFYRKGFKAENIRKVLDLSEFE
jgi:regulatory protein